MATNLAKYTRLKSHLQQSTVSSASQSRQADLVRWMHSVRKSDPLTIVIAVSSAIVAIIAIITLFVTFWPI